MSRKPNTRFGSVIEYTIYRTGHCGLEEEGKTKYLEVKKGVNWKEKSKESDYKWTRYCSLKNIIYNCSNCKKRKIQPRDVLDILVLISEKEYENPKIYAILCPSCGEKI